MCKRFALGFAVFLAIAPLVSASPAAAATAHRPTAGRGAIGDGVATHGPLARTAIVGGANAEAGAYPWLVLVNLEYHAYPGQWSAECTGALISPNVVLTAGHCVYEAGKATAAEVGFGVERSTLKFVKVAHIIPNPKFNIEQEGVPYDDTVLVLDEVVKTPYLELATPVDGASLETSGSSVHILGWGETSSYVYGFGSSTSPEHLQVATSTIDDPAFCGYQEQSVCVSNPASSTCFGDSGSPLVALAPDGQPVEIGDASQGEPREAPTPPYPPGNTEYCGLGSRVYYQRADLSYPWIAEQLAAYRAAPACTAASGHDSYLKSREAGSLSVSDALNTNLSDKQHLTVSFDDGQTRYHLTKLETASCEGVAGARVFKGTGAADVGRVKDYFLRFSLSEEGGAYYFHGDIAKDGTVVYTAGGPLKTKNQKIE